MHRLNGVYARRFNTRHDRKGHLFDARFWADELESDEHYLGVCLYVLHNPVRAGLCALATEWPWTGGEIVARLEAA